MAQHIPLEVFEQKAMKAIEQSIRRQQYFRTSMKFESLPADYNETPEDQAFITRRTVPKSIYDYGKATIEVHTEPIPATNHRIVTNIYLVT